MRYRRARPVAGLALALMASAAAGPSPLARAAAATAPGSPDPSSTTNVLTGVSATSASSAWAVGYYDTAGARDALVLRWNGTAWKQAAAPSPGPVSNTLAAVSATSASNAWAVGSYTDKAGTSAGNVWAAGYYVTSTNTTQTLILHWNGTAWKQVSSPDPARLTNTLYAVAAASASTAWAAGQYTSDTTSADDTLVARWNGTGWARSASPNAGSLGNVLSGMAATSASNAWAAGDSCTNVACTFSRTLILHWNGTAWSRAKSPSPSAAANALSALSATSASNAWAVGYYDDTATGTRDTLILRWNGANWSKV